MLLLCEAQQFANNHDLGRHFEIDRVWAQSLQRMGLEAVAHMIGGMSRWESDIGEIEPLPARQLPS